MKRPIDRPNYHELLVHIFFIFLTAFHKCTITVYTSFASTGNSVAVSFILSFPFPQLIVATLKIISLSWPMTYKGYDNFLHF